MLRVLVTDNDPAFIKALKHSLAGNRIPVQIFEALSGHETLELLEKNNYDALALDLDMPGMNGLKVLEKVKAAYPKLPVLILSFIPEEDESVSQAMKLGADGYLLKWNAPTSFLPAVERAVSKASSAPPSPYAPAQMYVPPRERLSEREYEVFCMLAQGKQIKTISEELNVSPSTVSTFKQRIMDKMGLQNDFDLAACAVRMQRQR